MDGGGFGPSRAPRTKRRNAWLRYGRPMDSRTPSPGAQLRAPLTSARRQRLKGMAAKARDATRGERARARLRRLPTALVLLLAVGALQAVAWDVAVAPMQGPDESGHFAYVQHFAETGSPPHVLTGTSSNSTEEQAALGWLNLGPLVGDLGARPAWSRADFTVWHRIERGLGAAARSDGSGPNPLAKNPPLYYVLMAAPYRAFVWLPLLKRLFVLRLFNALCYLATIALAWLIAGEIFGAVRWKQTLTAGVVALQPQLAFMSAVINADNLLVAVVTAFLLFAIKLVKYGPSLRRVAAVSVLASLAALTHGRGLAVMPVLLVALVVSLARYRPARLQAAASAGLAIACVGIALLAYRLYGSFAGGGSSLYGGQVGNYTTSATFNLRQFLSSIYQFYFPRLQSLRPRIGPSYGYRQVFIETFYGTFGSLEVRFPNRVYDALQVGSAVGLGAFYTACIVLWRRLVRAWPVVLVLLSLLVSTVGLLHYVSYVALLGNGGSDPLIVGRYLLPIIALFAVAITFTVSALPRALRAPTGALVLGSGVLLSLMGLGLTVTRFYA